MTFFKAREHAPIPNTDILSWIFDNPTYDIKNPVLIDVSNTSSSISFSQARSIVRKYIAGLQHLDVSPGDCVCIHSSNYIQYIMLALAIMDTSCIYAGTNPAYTPVELTNHLKTTATEFIISEPELLHQIQTATKTLSIPSSRIIVFPPTACSYTSSGTAGLPKACINTRFNLIAQHELNYSPTYWSHRYAPRHLWPLPLFHAAVGPSALCTALKNEEETSLIRRFELDA